MKTDKGAEKIITYSFCDRFKDRLVDHIRKEYVEQGRPLDRLAIVFGGKRPALFMKRDLAKILRGGFYPPRFFTIDEFMEYIAQKSGPSRHTQDMDKSFLLYKLAQKVAPQILQGRETFAQFLPWIQELLKFIDQLDLENIDDASLQNIQANAEIGYDVPRDINRLLESVTALRRAYHQELEKNQTYSRGLQYLRASQVIREHDLEEFDQVLFCNFFYFHRTEEKVVKDLYRRGKATLIFQGDQRKWPVLERISKMFKAPITEGETPKTPGFSLHLHAGFDVHSQVGLVREILKKKSSSDQTVIVLPDPGHLIPLLSEIHPLIKDFNVSMGYALKRSSLYSLFEFVFKAQLSRKEGRYYTKDYLRALRHPFIKNLKLCSQASVTRILIHKIEEVLTGKEKTDISGSLFISLQDVVDLDDIYILTTEMLAGMGIDVKRKELRSVLEEIHQRIFADWEEIRHFQDFAGALKGFLDTLIEKSFLENYPLNLNIATKIYAIKDEFLSASFAREQFSQEEMFQIFQHKAGAEMIAFSGSPLKGLQILGLLETRSLNFDHVIVLDVNEGVLPSLRVHEPLIPREVMISLGLDRLELEEEIQRYQFMRLISSAKHVDLVYQESKDRERSRFVEELIWEEQKKNMTMAVAPVTRPSFQVNVSPAKKIVRKTPEMVSFLKNHVYSASSINMYLRNPMEFYTSYVLGLKEQEDLLDEPEARHVGTFVHELLEESFRPFLNKKPKIDKAFRDRCAKILERKFQETFERTMKSDSFLLRSVVTERLNQFLDREQSDEQRKVEKVLFLESRFDDIIALPAGKIKFRYVVDRVDKMEDGTIMIVDYKTGSTDVMPKSADQIQALDLSRETIREHVRSFQIPLYFHYLDTQFPKEPINAGLYNLRTAELHRFIDAPGTADRKAINEAFVRALNFILAEILDPTIGFEEEENP
ncbi:MAG TPA: PD-(D/E)XK nuclease family protein [Candidatus Omnitrophota bacterium]|nr:PD-(D/E)XK nuclease family protein [Candidatus Omnitrophota bacterium]